MSGRAKHSRGKGSSQSKKKRSERRSHQVADARWQTVAQSDKPVTATAEVVASTPDTLKVAPATFNYPNLLYELRRIGILFGVILAIMIVLALVLD